MALGGGNFTTQNKVLPGSYINFISAAKATATLTERGYVAVPLVLSWGTEKGMFTITAEDFRTNSLRVLGYESTHESLKPVRELFENASVLHVYRLNSGTKASNAYATAKYTGARGNDIKISVMANENYTAENPLYDVCTYLDIKLVDMQTVTVVMELQDNDFVDFIKSMELAPIIGLSLTGGSDGIATNDAYLDFLALAEQCSYNVLCCPSDGEDIKSLFASFTKRMRDEVGAKFQCVLHRYTGEGHEGIVSVDNNESPELVYWVSGALAGCAVNVSCTNKLYSGEYEVNTSHTQLQLSDGIKAGKFILHKVMDDVRVLEDINTLTEFTEEKNEDFSSNQTIRVLDQIAMDIASLFSGKYLGKVPNDSAGRVSLWNDIVRHHKELETIRAIENFSADDVKVEAGNTKKAVIIVDHVTPVNAMAQLYTTVIIE